VSKTYRTVWLGRRRTGRRMRGARAAADSRWLWGSAGESHSPATAQTVNGGAVT